MEDLQPIIKTEHTPIIKTEHKPIIKTEHKPIIKTEHTPIIKTEHKPIIKTEPTLKPEPTAQGQDGATQQSIRGSRGPRLPFTTRPVVFETTVGMGEDTHEWWKSIDEMEADQRVPGASKSTREQAATSWSANKFS